MWDIIRTHRDAKNHLGNVKSHFVSHAVHFNAGTDDPAATEYHRDTRSCWSGFDAVGVFGKYDAGELEFPDLGYSFPSHPGDLFFLRGAAFRHTAVNWRGEGRMVFAAFSGKDIFKKECVSRPIDVDHMYGNAYRAFRRCFPVRAQRP